MSLRERLADRLAGTERVVVEESRLSLLEASDVERRQIQRDLDLLAYTALDYMGGAAQELKVVERRKLVQQARVAWMRDPQAGAAVDLMNDFVFGRGLPRPKANDPKVQEVIDEAWDDPDNQLILTSYAGQLCIGTDLSLQSNVFFLLFDDGQDGKVKLGLLDHDSVEGVVRDEDYRLRILYYLARETFQKWDYNSDQALTVYRPGNVGKTVRYYEHWRNVAEVKKDADSGAREAEPNLAPAEKTGSGKVYAISVNKTSEMAFGHPTFDRLLRWYNAYNKFMDARVDIMEASAAFVMKRKIKGTPTQLQKQATQALSRRSALAASIDYPDAQAGPKPASILDENENVTHEDFNINTNAPAAAQDAQMLRAQISAATRFPQSYYGDAANSSLATATSLELPVLKAVENRQEIFEGAIRFFLDRVIERAVEAGTIKKELDADEKADKNPDKDAQSGDTAVTGSPGGAGGAAPPAPTLSLSAAHEDAVDDEKTTERDLGYEFTMPSPLRRMMTDLITSIMNIARTFDPNNTNTELSRTLLVIALGEGLEMEDPAGAVDKIFPPGYVDPAIAAADAAPPPGGDAAGSQFGEFAPNGNGNGNGNGSVGADGQYHDSGNPYGAQMGSMSPDQMLGEAIAQLPADLRDRFGEKMRVRRGEFEARVRELAESEK